MSHWGARKVFTIVSDTENKRDYDKELPSRDLPQSQDSDTRLPVRKLCHRQSKRLVLSGLRDLRDISRL